MSWRLLGKWAHVKDKSSETFQSEETGDEEKEPPAWVADAARTLMSFDVQQWMESLQETEIWMARTKCSWYQFVPCCSLYAFNSVKDDYYDFMFGVGAVRLGLPSLRCWALQFSGRNLNGLTTSFSRRRSHCGLSSKFSAIWKPSSGGCFVIHGQTWLDMYMWFMCMLASKLNSTYTCVYNYIFTCMSLYIYVCVCVCVCVHVYIYIYLRAAAPAADPGKKCNAI